MEITKTIEVAVDPDTLFAYLGNVEKLAEYMPGVVRAERFPGNELRIVLKQTMADGTTRDATEDGSAKVLPDRRMEWRASGGYSGSVSVTTTDRGARALVTLEGLGGEPLAVDRAVGERLQLIKERFER
jgi:carbon monoxide dehydrogenase subunit G